MSKGRAKVGGGAGSWRESEEEVKVLDILGVQLGPCGAGGTRDRSPSLSPAVDTALCWGPEAWGPDSTLP